MNSMALLRSPQDWHDYRRHLSQTLNLAFEEVRWGVGPTAFPCLTMSYAVPNSMPARVVSCYVYPDDARRLLAASQVPQFLGMQLMPISPEIMKALPVPSEEPAPAAEPSTEAPANAANETLRSLTAHVLALVSEMIAIGATNEARYEAAYTRFTAMADQVVAERAALPATRAARQAEQTDGKGGDGG